MRSGGGSGRDFLIREGRRDVRGQELLVEARVNLPVWWELQLISGGSHLFENREGTDAFVVELLLWLRKVEVGGVQPDLVTDLVLRDAVFLLSYCRFILVAAFWSASRVSR